MKTLGLLGGMSWESTQTYYRLLNQQVAQRLGGLHSAKVILDSLDFADVEVLQWEEQWEALADLLVKHALRVEAAGADGLIIATNTMHRVAPQVEAALSIPLLHIADATAQALREDGVQTVGLLGTRFTMEQAFYRERLETQGITVLVPNDTQREEVHQIIYQELCRGVLDKNSRAAYLDVVEDLHRRGATGVILGCTEIGLLIKQHDTTVALYDTTLLHAKRGVEWALA
ncbi:MAG: aspartate/glutamate racemase family protein [Halomonas sp.]|nr:aspartate/glutamate racemase family protein [Halomonas sp.]TVM05783.1 MAG: aspartate/glutamate racemase family protein [Halomonas sp.]